MKATIELSDLVMLQMMGHLDSYVSELSSETGNPNSVVELARQRASTPQVFEEIVKKSIRAQFGESYTIVRELAQNGKDSYDNDVLPKKVEFTTKRLNGDFTVTTRDFGNGMSSIGMIRDLLVPYNSGKDKDVDKIGEHGIGWYSIMDFANVVDVISGKDGITTKARIQQLDGKWQATIETIDEIFKGTQVIAYADSHKENISVIRGELKKHVGFCDSDNVQIMLNDEQINTLDRNYALGGQIEVTYKGKTDTLDLHFKRNGSYDRKIPLTQDGLFIKEEDIPFSEGSIHYSFMNAMVEEGFNFWIDLPTNVGLTKGRNNVVARDRNQIYQAILPAFEQCVLDVVLEDDSLVRKMDSKISDWVRNIFSNTYGLEANKAESEPNSHREMVVKTVIRGSEKENLEEKIANGEVEKPDILVVTKGNDHFQDLKKPEVTSEREKKLEEVAKAYYEGMNDFSRTLFEKQFIPAQKYVGGETKYVKISIDDMIKAYASELLFDSRWHSGDKTEGLYVDGSFSIVSTVLYKLDELKNKRSQRLVASKKKSQASNEGSVSVDEVVSDTPTRKPSYSEKDTKVIEITNRTNLKKIKEVIDKEGIGQEYLGFLEVANYVDDLVSKANDMYEAPVMMHYNERMLFNVEIAHTDRKGISFNFADKTAYALVEKVREGSMDFDNMMKLVDVLIHEKAHCKRKEYDPSPEHGRRFYEQDKKELRENFIAYCFKKKIDPLQTANTMLGKHQYGIRTDPKEFGDLIEKYSAPEQVIVKTK